ncbi:expressed unknown protein [Seminavis robusta]|uniref:Uncharacterized protein n=1 Tax=Seminavis robusta TaxID=568900 RepID=A0A9N8H855_9STRA|nr:expressed unknown protein [Seminavis robusta]|eukprot:Sro205_g086200.1 n/a (468) ;mRNA; r:30418-31821
MKRSSSLVPPVCWTVALLIWLGPSIIPRCHARSLDKPYFLKGTSTSSLWTRGGGGGNSKSTSSESFNFHKNKPIVPSPKETLDDLEATASDEYIAHIIDQVSLNSTIRGDIILKYKPHRLWLWRRWHGTILQSSLSKMFGNMLLTAVICLLLGRVCGLSTQENLANPMTWMQDSSCIWIARLKVFDKLWHYQMQLTTFILTFFLTQAYTLWRDMYATGRKIQGRISDVGILLATHVVRDKHNQLSPEALDFLHDTARNLRLYHVLVWASVSRQFKVLLTNRGMTALLQRGGFITPKELETLRQLTDLPVTARHNAIVEWIVIRSLDATQRGILLDRQELFALLLDKIGVLKGTAAGIGDIVDGRMPLAYAHFVQVLVDCFLFAAPLALVSELGWLSIICVAFMTLFYEGLLDLAKIFLDPLNNEDYCEGGIDMDLGVFVREANAGTVKWLHGAKVLPFDTKPPKRRN